MISFSFRRFDHDKDGKLSLVEFGDEAYDLYKTYTEFENSLVSVIGAEEKFAELDMNDDGFVHKSCLFKLISVFVC